MPEQTGLRPKLMATPLAAGGTHAATRFLDRPQMTRNLVKGLFVLDGATLDVVYGPDQRRELENRVDFYAPLQTRESIGQKLPLLKEAEVIFSSWGVPIMDETFLEAAPNLRAVFHAAGTIRTFVTEAFWRRGIVVTSAFAANAVPVSEYTVAAIVLSLKNFWRLAAGTRSGAGWGNHTRHMTGGFRSTVGLISCGMIGRRTLQMLKAYDMHRLVSCPFLTQTEADELGVELCTLDEIFERSDVVSLHTPDLLETRGMVTGRHFAAMKPGATFINTARGRVIQEPQMIEALRLRPDLTAILDVCYQEPPPLDSPLLSLPNIILTPHIAGSLGLECRRLGQCMVEELDRYLAGKPLLWQIDEASAATMA